MYRVWLEDVLGFQLLGNRLAIRPALPEDWPGFSLSYRYRSSIYHISVERASPGKSGIEYDGQPIDGQFIDLRDDGGEHHVRVWLSPAEEVAETRDWAGPSVVQTAN
jgi:cellobiose phosphorylase